MKPRAEEADLEPPRDGLVLIEELLASVEAAPTPAERAVLLCRVAEIYERRLGDPENALVTLQAAFAQDPGSGRVVQEMERLARGSGRWAQVIDTTLAVAESLPDPRQAADLWAQIAFWRDTGLGELGEAADAARAALALVPDHGGALALLQSLYRRLRDWDRLVEILAKKWDNPHRDDSKIVEAYGEVLRYEPQHLGALEGLARLQEETGHWEAAAEMLRRLVAVVPEANRVALRHRLAVLLLEQLRDGRAAEAELVQTLALDPTHAASALTLAAMYRERGDWLKALQMLGRAADAVSEPAEKVRLLFESAEIRRTRLDDVTQAAELYAAVLAVDPAHRDAVEPLAAIWFKRGAWTALLPLAERLVADDDFAARPPAERARLHHQLGRAAGELGDEDRALATYRASLDADRTYAPALRDLGAIAFRREIWDEAAAAYEGLVGAPGAELKRDELLEALERQGVARLRAGDPTRAIAALERALALDERRRTALEALVEATSAAADFEAQVRHLYSLIGMTDDRDARLALHQRVAEIHLHKRGDPQRAIAAYMAAMDAKPDARPVMLELVELLTTTKQWKHAVAILSRLAELDEGPGRARTLVAAGNILHYELGNDADAVDAYDRALDADPEDLKTFERIDKLLTATHDWKTLERCYRRQIKRMGTDVPLEQRPALLALWQGLGEIYRSRLKDNAAAIAAFEVAASLDPENADRRADTGKILAELYEASGPAGYGKAVGEHRLLVRHAREARDTAPHIKQLLRFFVELGELDHAFCAAQALVVLGQADRDERALAAQYQPRAPVRAARRMTEDLWQRSLCHPDQDRLLSPILAAISPAVAVARAKPHKEWGLKRKHRRDVATDPAMFCRALAYASGVLSVAPPEVYLFPDAPGEIDLANVRESMTSLPAGVPTALPAFLVGREALEGRSETELGYVVARNLAMLRPDAFVRWPTVVPTLAELEIVVRAAIRLVAPDVPVPGQLGEQVGQYGDFLVRVASVQTREHLGLVVRRFLAAGGAIDVPRWARGLALTAIRTGLLVCGDLEVAIRLGQASSAHAGIAPEEVTRELVEWNVSEEYFTLRAELGLGAVNLDVALGH
jgi:tetratricopeptide (TPR) repeat protein